MVHEILPNRIVAVCGKGDFQLGPDSIHAGNQDRVFHASKIWTEEASESTDFAQHFRTMCGTNERVDSFFDFIAKVHIDPSSGIGFLFR